MFTTAWSDVDRKIGAGIALCGLTIALFNVTVFLGQASQFRTWWVMLVILVPLLQLISAALQAQLPPGWLRSIWLLQVLALFAVLFLTYFAWTGGEAPPPPSVWLLDSTVVGAATLVLRWPYAVASTLLLAAAVPLSAVAFLGTVPTQVLSWGFAHASNVIFVMIALVLRTQLVQLSRAHATADHLRAEEARTRAEEARTLTESEDSARFARIVHDEVLSTFSAAMQFTGAPPLLLRKSAASALVAMQRRQPEPGTEPAELSAEEAAALVLDLVSAAAPDVEMSSQIAPGTVRAAAAGAVGLAAAEAARNSVRHAGGGSGTVVVGDGVIRVAVIDSGPGFEWPLIESARFGIRESIVRRVEDLDGGRVTIDSGADGTTVVMAWKRPHG